MANPNVTFYRDIWVRLKEKGRAAVECQPAVFPRIRKAVQKEKHKDHKWRVANSHDTYRLVTTYDPQKNKATFTLVARLGIEDRRVV